MQKELLKRAWREALFKRVIFQAREILKKSIKGYYQRYFEREVFNNAQASCF